MNQIQQTSDKKVVPPYLSVAKLEKLFDLLSTRSLSRITSSDLVARGFSKQDSFLAIQTLKFLGLLSLDGKTTEKMRLFAMRGSEKTEKLQNILRESYKKIFETVPSAEKLTKDELYDELMANYGISQRLAKPAVLTFLWLCLKFGLETSEGIVSRPRNKAEGGYGEKKNQKSDPALQKSNETIKDDVIDNSYFSMNISTTGIRISFPKDERVEDAIISGDFSDARLKIIEFAKKVGLMSESKDSEIQSESV
ncbi:MAG TPA: DUF5343 domain-containing protein [Patescibacteria group bacterium]|nr:DUF5343 domain-containing protein [Patescibacteria group bacterium]